MSLEGSCAAVVSTGDGFGRGLGNFTYMGITRITPALQTISSKDLGCKRQKHLLEGSELQEPGPVWALEFELELKHHLHTHPLGPLSSLVY